MSDSKMSNSKINEINSGSTLNTQTEVEVIESTERWSEFKLSDGSILRGKLLITKVIRENKYDTDGNPQYNCNNTPYITIKFVQNEYKRKTN